MRELKTGGYGEDENPCRRYDNMEETSERDEEIKRKYEYRRKRGSVWTGLWECGHGRTGAWSAVDKRLAQVDKMDRSLV